MLKEQKAAVANMVVELEARGRDLALREFPLRILKSSIGVKETERHRS